MDPKQLKAFVQAAYKMTPNQAARAFAKEREKSVAETKKAPAPEVRTREQPKGYVKPAHGSLETGEKGGKFYRTENGTKVYVKD
jgi:hypothetical protein